MTDNMREPFDAVYQALENAVSQTVTKTKLFEDKLTECMRYGDETARQLRIVKIENECLSQRCKEFEQQLKIKNELYDALLKSYKELTSATNGSSSPGIQPATQSNITVKKEPVRMLNIPQSLHSSSKPLKLSPRTSKTTGTIPEPPPTKSPTPPATLASTFKMPSKAPTIKKPPLKQPLKPSLKRSASPSRVKQHLPKSKIPKLGMTSARQHGTIRTPYFVCPDCYNDWYNAKSDLDRSRKGLVVRNFSSHQKLIEHIFENHPSTATKETICPEQGCTDQKGHTKEPHGDAYKCAAPDANGETCGRTYQNRTDYRFHVNVEHANTSELNPRQLYSLWHTDFS